MICMLDELHKVLLKWNGNEDRHCATEGCYQVSENPPACSELTQHGVEDIRSLEIALVLLRLLQTLRFLLVRRLQLYSFCPHCSFLALTSLSFHSFILIYIITSSNKFESVIMHFHPSKLALPIFSLALYSSAAPPFNDLDPRAQQAPNWPGAIPPIQYLSKAYQGTITGYGKGSCNDPTKIGKCGFLGSGTFPQAAMSAGFNEAPEPGQCGTCWLMSNPRKLCYHPAAPCANPPCIPPPPTICPQPNVDPASESGLIVLVTNTCAPYYSPTNTVQACNQQNGSKDALGSDTVVDLCMDTDAAQAWWNSTTQAGMNVATIQRVNCSSWPGHMGPQASWLNGGYTGGPGYLPPAPPSARHVVPQSVSQPLLATVELPDGGGPGVQQVNVQKL